MNKAEKRHRAAHALKALGFKQNEIARVLKVSQPRISVYLQYETYIEMQDAEKARKEALEQKKKQPVRMFQKWFGNIVIR